MIKSKASVTRKVIPTVETGKPTRHPMFFDYRVYQGSNGSVYPLPFIDSLKSGYVDAQYDLVTLENDYVYLEFLPEIGGRIFKGQDKTNRNYDFFYRQDVIKPALVGLAGPWISGGVEFNWPQHHRPGTYMPCDYRIEEELDGAITVWFSELDPLSRMKGTYGIRLRPDSSLIELRARLYNCTSRTQTFLWWANVAAKVHDQYQSFFPPDVSYVADHAVRAMSSFPVAEGTYYGIDYYNRPGANDLSFYRNIPVPTSYMICESEFDFFGGYDHLKEGGFVHVANKHISPGKKQWTWGNHEFGRAWDRELTETGGPYVELMAGVYTDNQPDFSYLVPYETKCFSQFWWPIQKTGPVQNASKDAAVRLVVRDDRRIDAAALVTRAGSYRIILKQNDRVLIDDSIAIQPGAPWINDSLTFSGETASALSICIYGDDGCLLLDYQPVDEICSWNRELALEPQPPEEIDSVEDLFLIGEHLEQYRHPTRHPVTYWEEAIRRTPGDMRSRIALGKAAMKVGNFSQAVDNLEVAIRTQTKYHPNPSSGEAFYYLGLCLEYVGRETEAYAQFYKSSWNLEWRSPAYHRLACLDVKQGNLCQAVDHLHEGIKTNSDNPKSKVLLALLHSTLGHRESAVALLHELAALDPLNPWTSFEMARIGLVDKSSFLKEIRNDAQTMIDVCLFYAEAGFYREAREALDFHLSNPIPETATSNPLKESQMILYLYAWIENKLGDSKKAEELLAPAGRQDPDYFFPSRLEEQIVLEWAVQQKSDPLACYGLGNLYYSNGRRQEAIQIWEKANRNGMEYATLYRNLSIAHWNANRDAEAAEKWFDLALEIADKDPHKDPQLIYEYDLLHKKLGKSVDERLGFLKENLPSVLCRDDATIHYLELLNLKGRHSEALEILSSRRFHPWEGGEGKAVRQYAEAQIGQGVQHLGNGHPEQALEHFRDSSRPPENLGEHFHPLQAKGHVNYWIGRAYKDMGSMNKAEQYFLLSCEEINDFSNMEVVSYSEYSIYKAKALIELGREQDAIAFLTKMSAFCRKESERFHKIDYFATSLPNILVFEEDFSPAKQESYRQLSEAAEDLLGMIQSVMSIPKT